MNIRISALNIESDRAFDEERLRAAIRHELGKLMQQSNACHHLQQSDLHLDDVAIQAGQSMVPEDIGTQIARSIYEQMTSGRSADPRGKREHIS